MEQRSLFPGVLRSRCCSKNLQKLRLPFVALAAAKLELRPSLCGLVASLGGSGRDWRSQSQVVLRAALPLPVVALPLAVA